MGPDFPKKEPARAGCPAWVGLIFLLLVLFSVPLRLPELGKPLLGRHNFRQTQTAITVWTFEETGIRPFGYQTPVFGPPWRVPLEFPTFQIAAAGLGFAGMDIDMACRLTNILFFYLSALLLYLLCRHLVPRTRVAEMAVVAFCWMPFNIYWSAQSMIDFAAVAFALAYTLGLLKWVEGPGRIPLFGGTMVAGVLAYLTKVTTMAAFLPLICGLVLTVVLPRISSAGHLSVFLRTRWRFVAGLAVLIVTPVLFEHAWVRYSDHVKAGSPFTAWLTSENLVAWNFGRAGQRLLPANWSTIADHLGFGIPTFIFLVLAGLGFVALCIHDQRGRVLFLGSAAGVFVAIATFFNLYLVHDYYLIAVTAMLAVVVGFALDLLLVRPFKGFPLGVLVLVAIAGHIASGDLSATQGLQHSRVPSRTPTARDHRARRAAGGSRTGLEPFPPLPRAKAGFHAAAGLRTGDDQRRHHHPLPQRQWVQCCRDRNRESLADVTVASE